jgi:hypothetical protein
MVDDDWERLLLAIELGELARLVLESEASVTVIW